VPVVPYLLGLGTGLSLIVAVGAQNAYVLRVGLVAGARIVLPMVLLCALSDAVLITAGTLGIGALVEAAPQVLTVLRVLGAAFLVCYGLLAFRRALHPEALLAADAPQPALGRTLLTVAAFTWLNPHVYLDTVLFLGSVANQQGAGQRWWWVTGATTASFVWFFGLGFGARALRPLFARPASWRVLDVVIGVVMVGLGIRLALG
jgi:L-lysine exporter family protein LysE/ArgO